MSVRLAGTAAALLAMTSVAMAETPLDTLIKPEAGSSACFIRFYNAGHLRTHPKQRTSEMKVWLSYEQPSGTASPILTMALSISRRGDPAPMFSQGGCNWDEQANRDTSNNRLIRAYLKDAGAVCLQSARPDVFESVSAEEGGSLILDPRDRETLMVYLDDRLTLVRRADRAKQYNVRFGPEDRVFMLSRADAKECEAVKEAVTTPERKPAQ